MTMAGGTGPAVAVVTGAARGIGFALASALHRQGFAVAGADRSWELTDGEPRLPRDDRILELRADITDEESVRALRERVLERFGRVDVLVNNVALRQRDLYFPTGLSYVLDTSSSDWEAMFRVNVLGTLLVTRTFVEPLIARGSGGGVISVGTGGFRTERVGPGTWALARHVGQNHPYEGSKAAMASMMLSLAEELREHEIAVNVVFPAGTRTTGSDEMVAARAAAGFHTPALLDPAHLAPLVLHLARERGRGPTGRMIDAVAWNEANGFADANRPARSATA